jgi:hypothetical protein
VADWHSAAHLLDHFGQHGWELACRTVEAYDESAQLTLEVGRYFEYEDPGTGRARVGCYDRPSRRFVALTPDDEIVTHYRCSVRHVRNLPHSTYDDER